MKQLDRMLQGKLYSCYYEDKDREDLYNKRNEFLNAFNDTKFEDFKTREIVDQKIFCPRW